MPVVSTSYRATALEQRSGASLLDADVRPLRLSLLDGFELCCDGSVIEVAPAGQRLVAFLALQQRTVQRGYVAGRLWLDASERRAQASLRTTLWRTQVPGAELLHATSTHLRLGDAVHVDFQRALACARQVLEVADGLRGDALATLAGSGELLPDWYDEWLMIERERFRQLRMLALEALCVRLSAKGLHAEAVQAGLAAVAAEPLRESAQRALVAAHLANGNACEAIRQYRLFATLLRHHLGLTPSDRMRGLVAGMCAP